MNLHESQCSSHFLTQAFCCNIWGISFTLYLSNFPLFPLPNFHLSYTFPLTILKQRVFITNFQTSAQGDKNNTIFRTREPSTSFPELLPWRSSSLGNEVGEPWILMWTSEITCLTGFILYTSFEVKSTQFMFYKERRQIYLDFLKLKVFIYKMFHFYEEFL